MSGFRFAVWVITAYAGSIFLPINGIVRIRLLIILFIHNTLLFLFMLLIHIQTLYSRMPYNRLSLIKYD